MPNSLPVNLFFIFGINSVVFRLKVNVPHFLIFSKNRISCLLDQGNTFCKKVHKFQDEEESFKKLLIP